MGIRQPSAYLIFNIIARSYKIGPAAAPHLKPTSQKERYERMVAKREVDVPLTASPGTPEPLTPPKKTIVVSSAADSSPICTVEEMPLP